MRPLHIIRRQNLARIVADAGGQAPFAALVRKDKNQVYQWLLDDEANPQHRKMSHRTARAVETMRGLPDGWLDTEQPEPFSGAFAKCDITPPSPHLLRPATDRLRDANRFMVAAFASYNRDDLAFDLDLHAEAFALAYEWLGDLGNKDLLSELHKSIDRATRGTDGHSEQGNASVRRRS